MGWTPPNSLCVLLFVSLLPCLPACDLVQGWLGDGQERGAKRERHKDAEPQATPALSYLGRDTCRTCHAAVDKEYSGSQHEYATQVPSEQSVRAPMKGEGVTGKHLGATFVAQEGAFTIKSSAERRVKWTLGVEPLQQFVFETDAGRVQAFPAAFDTRKEWEGGQKWSLLEGADVPADSPLHYLGPAGNWNSGCGPCHSTNVEKNLNPETQTYDTKFSELNVSCEACHGAGSHHVSIAKGLGEDDPWPATEPTFGFPLALSKRGDRRWFRRREEDTAKLTSVTDGPPEETQELASCGPCHAHRLDLGPSQSGTKRTAERKPTDPFFDRYLLPFLEEPQTLAAVQTLTGPQNLTAVQTLTAPHLTDPYSLGPFLLSRKAEAGVICSDCHAPHSTLLRKPVEELCVTCHNPEKYDSPAHDFHPEGTDPEVLCVDCHMPESAFLGIDQRRDHSFSIPRPDLSETTGEPTACTSCHQGKSAAWAKSAIQKAHGEPKGAPFELAFHAVRHRVTGAAVLLTDVYDRTELSPLVRASALKTWSELDELFLDTAFQKAVKGASSALHPLLRRAAALAAQSLPEKLAVPILSELLSDEVRTVRISAALGFSLFRLEDKKLSPKLEAALVEAEESGRFNADSLEGLLMLGDVQRARRDAAKARKAYERAAAFAPKSPAPILRIHALFAETSPAEAASFAASSMKAFPDLAELHHSVGAVLVQKEETRRAGVAHLKTAFENAPPRHRRTYGYTYAVTMDEIGDWAEALALLRLLDREIPGDPKVNQAMELIEARRSR